MEPAHTSSPIRWGILGTARIATKVGRAIQAASGAELTAIASRSEEKARGWAAEHQVPRHFGNYQVLLDDPDIDAVYMPLPPSLHLEWTARAAERGKHVLCEKPIALDASEAEQMWSVCQQHGVQLMDGVMWYHHPRALQMAKVLRDGTLGTLRRVTSAFSFCWKEIPKNEIRLNRQMRGGSLWDLGWYCVGAALWAFNAMPHRVYGTASWYNDVDMHFSGLLWFDQDRTAAFDSGFDTEMRRWIEVAGTDASLVCDDFTNPWDSHKPRFWLNNSTGTVSEHIAPPVIQEVQMIQDFGRIIRTGQLDPSWPETAIRTQHICDALDHSARTDQPVEVAPASR